MSSGSTGSRTQDSLGRGADPLVWVIGGSTESRAGMVAALRSEFRVAEHDVAPATADVDQEPSLLVLLEPPLEDMAGYLSSWLAERARNGQLPVVLDDASATPDRFDCSRCFVVPAKRTDDQIRAICAAALDSTTQLYPSLDLHTASQLRSVLGHVKALSGLDEFARVVDALAQIVLTEARAVRCYCLTYDSRSGILHHSRDERSATSRGSTDTFLAGTGLAGLAACTGRSVTATSAHADPRCVLALDDPGGSGKGPVMAIPIKTPENVYGVLVVVGKDGDAFSSSTRGYVEELCRQLGPVFARFGLEQHTQQLLLRARERSMGATGLFRGEAVHGHFDRNDPADVARILPSWLGIMYPAAVALFLLLFGASFIVQVGTYAEGPALIRSAHSVEIMAPSTGQVVHVNVRPGERVDVGQVLASFDAEEEEDAFSRAEQAWKSTVRSYLSDPGDYERATDVAETRRTLDAAKLALRRRRIIATHGGVVSEAHVQVGQVVSEGQPLLSIRPLSDTLDVIAVLPASDRPMAARSRVLRFELNGHDRVRVNLPLRDVGGEVLGPSELHRFLGPVAEGLQVEDAGVLVRATLTEETFEVDGRTYPFEAGMSGMASIRTGSRSVLLTLFPALQELRVARDVELPSEVAR